MRHCNLKLTSDRVVATRGHMPRLIPPGSLLIFFLTMSRAISNQK